MRLDGENLLLLVGPTMSLEGPAVVLRWRDAVHDEASGVIDRDRIETVAELPYQLHVDHPEGIDLWPEAGLGALLVIYDAPAPERTDPDTFTVRADVICPQKGESFDACRVSDGRCPLSKRLGSGATAGR